MLRLKRAFAGRRKNNSQDVESSSTPSTSTYNVLSIPRSTSPRPGVGRFNVFTTKKGLHSQSQLVANPDSTRPPTPPPKEDTYEASPDPYSQQVDEFGRVQVTEIEERADWRKSNSTTHTVKPLDTTHMHKRKERDMSPNSTASRSPSSASSQLSSNGSSHTSVSAYPANVLPAKRTTKRSFTSGLIPESLTLKREGVSQNTDASQVAPPSSYRPSPSASPAPTPKAWPQMFGSAEVETLKRHGPVEQQRATTLSFTNTTLHQLGKKAVGKINFKGWGSGIARSSSPGSQANVGSISNSSSSSLSHSENAPKGRSQTRTYTVGGQKGNHSVHSFNSGSGSDAEARPPLLSGPHLGVLMRPPIIRSGQGGLVFGRDLASATQETRVSRVTWTQHDLADSRELEDRILPALVLRCAIHLRKWGLDEEGIFRYFIEYWQVTES